MFSNNQGRASLFGVLRGYNEKDPWYTYGICLWLTPKDSGPLKGWFSILGGSGSRFPVIAIFSSRAS